MRLKNSFWALLGREVAEAPAVVAERIRKAMLFSLDTHCGTQDPDIDVRIMRASGITELWYLRPDLMQVLSVCAGESVARDALAQITALFVGYHAMPAPSRFSPL